MSSPCWASGLWCSAEGRSFSGGAESAPRMPCLVRRPHHLRPPPLRGNAGQERGGPDNRCGEHPAWHGARTRASQSILRGSPDFSSAHTSVALRKMAAIPPAPLEECPSGGSGHGRRPEDGLGSQSWSPPLKATDPGLADSPACNGSASVLKTCSSRILGRWFDLGLRHRHDRHPCVSRWRTGCW